MVVQVVWCMCFYDYHNRSKRKCTEKMLRFMKYVQAKYHNRISFDFMLCGSEAEYSRSLILNEGFKKSEYCEYQQPNTSKMKWSDVALIIGQKHEFMYQSAIAKYPNLDILLSSGSSDFIPISFFDQLLTVDYSLPQCFGITPYHLGGYVYILNFVENSTEYDMYRIDSSKSRDQNPMLAGAIGFSRVAISRMDNKILLPSGNEQTLLKICIEHEIELVPLADYWINVKIQNCDLTKLENIVKYMKLTKQVEIEPHIIEHVALLNSFHV